MTGALAQPWPRRACLFGLGAAAALGHAPTDLWFLTPLALAAWLALHVSTQTTRQGFGTAWWLGLGYFAVSLRWIVEPFLVDAATFGWMAPFAIILMASGAAIFWGIAGWVATRFAPKSAFSAIAALTLAEITRSYIFTGFPWALIGHIWIDTPIAQSAAFWGPHGLTLIALLLALAIFHLSRRHLVWAVVPAAIGAAWFIPVAVDPVEANAPTIRIVQPNVLQNEKWDPVYKPINFQRTLDLSTTNRGDIGLIVWPETAVADILEYAQPSFDAISEMAQGIPVITGVQRRSSGDIFHNSLILLGRGGVIEATYDKQHLVPFGEFVPGGEIAARLGLRGLASSQGFGFTKGTTADLIDISNLGPIRPLICYEGIFAEEIGSDDGRPRLLLLITNDAWFGKGAGPEQHLAQARLRAIERGLPMIRSANTGISAVIDARGRVLQSLPLDTAGFIDAALPPALPKTLYSKVGDSPMALVALFLLTLGIRRTRRFRH